MRLLVCGGRDFTDDAAVYAEMDAINEESGGIALVIHGGARGADSIAGHWANDRGVPCRVYPARWDLHGKAAGARRNAEMLALGKPDLVLAMPGGRGTADMVAKARRAGVMTVVWGT